ncbi:MAG TPA: hypothetical protein VF063_01325 [Gaiellaceae bacterium]
MRVARVLVPVLICALAFAGRAHSARAATPVVVPRPTNGGLFAYTAPESQPYVTTRAVVHYVTSGPQAPALTDADGNGVPDYVEQVGAAADVALLYYERHGFKQPLPDTAGPDTKPDIYIDTLPAGVLGFTLKQAHAEGGTFVLVSPTLDTTTSKPNGGVDITVAHELFHLIQFSYLAGDKVPTWAFEGSATAMSTRVFPQAQDRLITAYLNDWLKTPWVSLDDERGSCAHCYGGAWWWLYLTGLSPKVLPRYLSDLAADQARGASTTLGVTELDKALRSTGRGSLEHVFTRFSLNLYRRGLPLGNPFSLKSSTRPRKVSIRAVSGLSTHYVPVSVPRGARGLIVSVPYGQGPPPNVALVVGGPHGREIVAKRFRPGRGVVLSTLFRNPSERRRVTLIVTLGTVKGASYRVEYAAVGRHGKLPGWVAF